MPAYPAPPPHSAGNPRRGSSTMRGSTKAGTVGAGAAAFASNELVSSAPPMSLRDLSRFVSPSLPASSQPHPTARGGGSAFPAVSSATNQSHFHNVSSTTTGNASLSAQSAATPPKLQYLLRDALSIVEQKAPDTMRLVNNESSGAINRFRCSRARGDALQTLPLAFPPIRFRRGETIEEYIESVTKPWEEVRKASLNPAMARRLSLAKTPNAIAGGDEGFSIEEKSVREVEKATSGSSYAERHRHLVSGLWRQTHQTKADLISGEEASRSVQQPLLEAASSTATHLEQQMVHAMSVQCKEGVTATPRGLVVPYPFFGALVNAVTDDVEEVFRACFVEDNRSANPLGNVPEPGHPARHSYVMVNAAFRVSVLWRMLEQIRTIVPGMETALALFESLLPLIYIDIDSMRLLGPSTMSSVATQMQALVTLPLAAVELQRTESNESQLRQDTEYLRLALQNWSFTIWRHYNSMDRRRTKFLVRLHNILSRFDRQRTLQRHFFEWRTFVHRSKNSHTLVELQEEFRTFVKNAQHAATDAMPMSSNRAIAANQARFVAQKLAATARHTHRAPPAPPQHPTASSRVGGPLDEVQQLAGTATAVSPLRPTVYRPPMIAGSGVPPLDSTPIEKATTTTTGGGLLSPIAPELLLAGGAVRARSATPAAAAADRLSSQGQTAPTSVEESRIDAPPSVNSRGDTHLQSSTSPPTTSTSPFVQAIRTSIPELFHEVIGKLQTVEDVSGHLREFIAIQKASIAKLQSEKQHAQNQYEASQLHTHTVMKENLRLNNLLHQQEQTLQSQRRQIVRLKCKVRHHRHRLWRQSTMRVLSSVLGVSNTTAELDDASKLYTEMTGVAPVQKAQDRFTRRALIEDIDDGGEESATEAQESTAFLDSIRNRSEAERLFGRMAPLILTSPAQLPPAQEILRDWVNNCLDDLQAIDGNGGQVLSVRLSAMSNEVRDGVLLSRLLFYLALPRFEPQKPSTQLMDVSPDCATNRARLLQGKHVQLHSPFPTYDDCFGDLLRNPPPRRMNLLLNFASELLAGVGRLSAEQLNTLDIFTARAQANLASRASQENGGGARDATDRRRSSTETNVTLLNDKSSFAKEPTATFKGGDGVFADQSEVLSVDSEDDDGTTTMGAQESGVMDSLHRGGDGDDPYAEFDGPSQVELLQQYVDPLLLAEGSKTSVVTLLAMLYVRFASAFQHKANATQRHEKELLRQLLSDVVEAEQKGQQQAALPQATSTQATTFNTSMTTASNIGGGANGAPSSSSPLPAGITPTTAPNEMLVQLQRELEAEEKSPWQLFLEYCRPMLASTAHSFVLDGRFWSAFSCESPEILEVFSAMTNALHQSLLTHRWHIQMMCLAPLASYHGLSRGVFCGQLASVQNFLYQQSLDGQEVALSTAAVYVLGTQRKEIILPPELMAGGVLSGESVKDGALLPRESSIAVSGTSPLQNELNGGQPATDGIACRPPVAHLMFVRESSYYRSVCLAVKSYLVDLARLYLNRAVVRQSMGVPTLPLASWRQLWTECGLCPERLSLDTITRIYAEATEQGEEDRESHIAAPSPMPSPGLSYLRQPSMAGTTSEGALLHELNFSEFCEAIVRVAHHRYAPVTMVATNSDDPTAPRQRVQVPLYEALGRLMVEVLMPLMSQYSPAAVSERLRSDIGVQDVLRRTNAELTTIFQAYAKVRLGVVGMEKEDALRLVKDCGIASAELSYQVITELFLQCGAKRTYNERVAQRNMDPRQLEDVSAAAGDSSPTGGSLMRDHSTSNSRQQSVVASKRDPSRVSMNATMRLPNRMSSVVRGSTIDRQTLKQQQLQSTMDRVLLSYEEFVTFLLVLLQYKAPNPFVPVEDRLAMFLERSIIGPLRYRMEQLEKAKKRAATTKPNKEGGNAPLQASGGATTAATNQQQSSRRSPQQQHHEDTNERSLAQSVRRR